MAEEATAVAPIVAAVTDPMVALSNVIKKAHFHEGLCKGLNECVKALDRGMGKLCCLAEDCDEQTYVKLIKALAQEHKVPLIMVSSKEKLGEWCGLCKIDNEGAARRIVKSSCCVITDFGEQTPDIHTVLSFAK